MTLVSLADLPSGSVAFSSFPCVRARFLAFRKIRLLLSSRGKFAGCKPRQDVNIEKPAPLTGSVPVSPTSCQFTARLRRKARTCVRFLSREHGLKRAYALPSRITCGNLRSTIRRCFGDLTEIEELSVKTTQKLEKSFCRYCDANTGQTRVNKWNEERFLETQVDNAHLSKFAAAFGRNVDVGWNRGKFPYIPSGNACLGVCRAKGGTWVPGEFSADCDVCSVVSAGKPRVVTLFSEFNTSVLHSLHASLFDTLRRKGWLLVGSPTNEQVTSLNGCEYISVDYRQATDNIKVAYTRAAIEVLIDKGEGLSDVEKACLRVVGALTIDGRQCTRGQPMGSKMSFPLLCLINKTVVDLALNDLLIEGKIQFKEWTGHRCLINGDDLLTRDVTCRGLLPHIVSNGVQVGLCVNLEKTGVDAEQGEINSTLFLNGVQQKKVNCGALFMGRDEADVIGFADRSCLTTEGFLYCVRRARLALSLQDRKLKGTLPFQRFRALIRDPDIRPSLLARASKGAEPTNFFPVVAKPAGYDLSREEEVALISEEVDRLRSVHLYRSLGCGIVWGPSANPVGGPRDKEHRRVVGSYVSLRKMLKRERPSTDEDVLRVLSRGWQMKVKRGLYEQMHETDPPSVDIAPSEHVCDQCGSLGLANRLVCEIRELKRVSWLPVRARQVPGADSVPQSWAL